MCVWGRGWWWERFFLARVEVVAFFLSAKNVSFSFLCWQSLPALTHITRHTHTKPSRIPPHPPCPTMLRYATELLARRGAAAGAAGAISRRGLHGDALWMSTLSANDKTPSNPPPTTVHTVTGQDAKGIISKILDAVCSRGGTVVSSRSVRMGGEKSSDDRV